jgi:hypothetical protein
MSASERRLHELIDFVLDGSCTDEQRQEFAQIIDEHPDLIKGLTQEVFTHSLLQWRSENISRDIAIFGESGVLGESAEACPLVPAADLQTACDLTYPGNSQRFNYRRLMVWAIAATVLVAGAYSFWQTNNKPGWESLAVAEIIDVENVSWDRSSTALKPGSLIVPGRLKTQAGEFTLRFRTGPVVRVIGAASMMIETDMLVHLDRGQATARVPNSMKGLR